MLVPMLQALDRFMESHPWHPRVVPFVVYVAMLFGIGWLREVDARAYVAGYVVMCVITAWLLWRYRRLTPELNWRFHWLAVPVALLATVGWIWPGMVMSDRWPTWFDGKGDRLLSMGPALGWTAVVLRAIGMSVVVAMFEELFFRSAMLRSLHEPRWMWIAVVQWAEDLPVIGEKIAATKMARAVADVRRPLAVAMERTPVGVLSVFSVIASSVLWAPISHHMRDWPGTLVCGVLYALLVGWTNRGERRMGLGPVVWAHGLTNLFLCAWTVWSDDWRFL
jgi:hypothetical protein